MSLVSSVISNFLKEKTMRSMYSGCQIVSVSTVSGGRESVTFSDGLIIHTDNLDGRVRWMSDYTRASGLIENGTFSQIGDKVYFV